MMLLTMVVSLPFTRTGIWATRFNKLVSVVIACTCFSSGGMIAYEKLLLRILVNFLASVFWLAQ
jgi:hypothetical protein